MIRIAESCRPRSPGGQMSTVGSDHVALGCARRPGRRRRDRGGGSAPHGSRSVTAAGRRRRRGTSPNTRASPGDPTGLARQRSWTQRRIAGRDEFVEVELGRGDRGGRQGVGSGAHRARQREHLRRLVRMGKRGDLPSGADTTAADAQPDRRVHTSINSYSNGTSVVILPHIVGSAEEVLRQPTSWPTIVEHTDLVVAFGGIPAKNVFVTHGGVTQHHTSAFLDQAAAAAWSSRWSVRYATTCRRAVPATWYPIVRNRRRLDARRSRTRCWWRTSPTASSWRSTPRRRRLRGVRARHQRRRGEPD